MKRPVLGIIAVFCIQFAFIAYTALDRLGNTMISADEVSISEVKTATSPDNFIHDELLTANADQVLPHPKPNDIWNRVERKEKRSITPFNARNKNPASSLAATTVINVPQYVALRDTPEAQQRSGYLKPGPIIGGQKNYELSARTQPRSGRRPLVSKSLSVLKKPYDWLKAIASRIR